MILTTIKRSVAFIGLWFVVAGQFPTLAWGSPGAVNTRAAMVVNVSTDRILLEHNVDAQIPPASITKVLTLYLVFEAIHEGRAHLSDRIVVSEKAGRTGGSRMYIQAGTEVTLEELIKGMAVDSGNDACVAAAEHIAGSDAAFVDMMNRKARELGMSRSHFVNPNGLPARGQVTTARDMARLSMAYLHRFPESLRVHSIQNYSYNGVTQHNRNRLLGHCPGVDGIKTGWIAASGYNLLATAKRGDTRILVVVLGAPNPAARLTETRKLIEVAYQKVAAGSQTIALADLAGYVDPYCAPPGKRLPHGKPRKTTVARKAHPSGGKISVAAKGHARRAAKSSKSSEKTVRTVRNSSASTGNPSAKTKSAKANRQAAAQHTSQTTKHASAQIAKRSSKTGHASKPADSTAGSKKKVKSKGESQLTRAKSTKSNSKSKDKTVDSKKKPKAQAKKGSSHNT